MSTDGFIVNELMKSNALQIADKEGQFKIDKMDFKQKLVHKLDFK